MKSSIGSINNVDISAVIGFNIVALDRNLADILPIGLDAALVCCRRNRRDEIANFFGVVRIAYIDRSNPGIEPGHKRELSVENRGYTLIGGMRAKAAAALAEILVFLLHRIARYNHWLCLNGRIHEPYHLSRLTCLTLVDQRFIDNHDDVSLARKFMLGEIRDSQFAQWKGRVSAIQRGHFHLSDDRIAQVVRSGL